MKIAAQGFTIREFTKTAQDVEKSLKKIAAIGYKAVQISGFAHYDAEQIANVCKSEGLEIFVTHTPLDRIVNDTEKVIGEHKLFGAKYVGLGWYDMKTKAECEILINKLKRPVDLFHEAKLKFVYHNHAHEFAKDGGVCLMDYLLESLDPKKAGMLADLYWLQFAGFNPSAFVEKRKSRIEIVHLKDMKATPDGLQTFTEVFEGNMDYDGILEACKKAGVKYAAVEQDACPGDPFESLKISYNNLKARGYV